VTDARADRAVRDRCAPRRGVFTPFDPGDVEGTIPARFEAQARRHADRPAVVTPGRRLTYGEVDREANRVAHAVLDGPGDPGAPVALLLDDGAAFVPASLGVLKAARVQVPLELTSPPERLAYMLRQSGARTILTDAAHQALAARLGGGEARVVDVGALGAGLSDADPGVGGAPGDAVVVEYTSGSTGEPKGIARSQRAVLHDVLRHTAMARIGPGDRLLIPRLALMAYLRALLNGAAFYPASLAPEALAALPAWLAREEISVYRSVVSAFRSLAGTLTGGQAFPHLRLIVLYGEPVYQRDVDLYRRHFADHCLLVSTLGTAETGDYAHFFVDRETRLPGGVVPGGYPAEEMEVLFLDDGAPPRRQADGGELAVRSPYVATGYWRRPDLTDRLFLPDPDGGDRRIYRTGDVGRRGADGCLYHLGRKDFQVKVNGHRVHVAEVEAALLALEGVREAAVVGREDTPGSVRLAAYLTAGGSRVPTTSELRRQLAARLPDHMLPSTFVVLDALPLTPTGKVDRRALPAPDGRRPALDAPFVAPRTPVEAALAGIWAEILRLDRVGVNDDFLELGGDSLLATVLVSRVIERFALALPLAALLATRTLAEMAGVVVGGLLARTGEAELARLLAETEGQPGGAP
jgi:amino acid adenylation domain-containing protein